MDSKENSRDPIIKVFAINEEAYTFITGVSSEFEEYIHEYIDKSNSNIIKGIDWYLNNKDYKDETIEKLKDFVKISINEEYKDLTTNIQNIRQHIRIS